MYLLYFFPMAEKIIEKHEKSKTTSNCRSIGFKFFLKILTNLLKKQVFRRSTIRSEVIYEMFNKRRERLPEAKLSLLFASERFKGAEKILAERAFIKSSERPENARKFCPSQLRKFLACR